MSDARDDHPVTVARPVWPDEELLDARQVSFATCWPFVGHRRQRPVPSA